MDLADLPQEDAVYDMLCRADSVGVFQIESRAQMATLPRLRPRCFYDLVVEVALIRPGPIQGGSVHPYIRRRKGEEPVTYLHPLLENSLAKTLGVPLFQEQLMQMAIDVAGFTPAEADQLRQAMASKRSERRMAALRERFDAGLAANGITGEVAEAIWEKLAAFANYGFPESHSVSFAYLVYASSWLKFHYPAAFCAALLNAQPMGFYSPQSLDPGRPPPRRGGAHPRPERLGLAAPPSSPPSHPLRSTRRPDGGERGTERMTGTRRRGGGVARRCGWASASVRGIGEDLAKEIAAGRPYTDVATTWPVAAASTGAQLEALATAGALGCFDRHRRPARWTGAGRCGPRVRRRRSGPTACPGIVVGMDAPRLPGMDDWEESVADLWATGVAPDGHPTRFLRDDLDRRGVVHRGGAAHPDRR